MLHLKIGFISLPLLLSILVTTAFRNTIPPMAIALVEGRTHDQGHDIGYIDWSGPVQYVQLWHRDNTELPPEEGSVHCGSGCLEQVTRLGNGGSVSGSFDRNVSYFEVMVAASHDSNVGNATLRACSSANTWDLYYGPGGGPPGFMSLVIGVPAGCRSWSLSVSSGYGDFRAVEVYYAVPPSTPTNTSTPLPTATPTNTFTPTVTSTPTNTPPPTFTPTSTATNTPSPTPTPLPPEIVGQLVCGLWGNAGWCRGDESLDLTATDPQGFDVTISGDLNGDPFSCGSSCSASLPEGIGNANYTVISTSGQTASGTSPWQRDSSAPVVNFVLPSQDGKNGWFVSPVDISADATDAISGLSSISASVDGGTTWISFPIHLSDGVFSVDAHARDLAGNEVTKTEVVRVDTVPPVSQFTSHSNGDVVQGSVTLRGTAEDQTSGISNAEFSLDGGATWATVPVVSGNSWSLVWNTNQMSNGQYSLQIRGADQAGNVGAAASITLTVNNVSSQASLDNNNKEVITVPFVATSTATATAIPLPTVIPSATPQVIPAPSQQPSVQQPLLAAPLPDAPPNPVHPQNKALLWPLFGLFGLIVAISSASVVDPRPRALKLLTESLKQSSRSKQIVKR